MQLREYQDFAIEQIKQKFQQGNKKVLLVAPTGSGKTVIASRMIEKATQKNKRCLFVAHRRELVTQCSNKLHEFGIDAGVIMAGITGSWVHDTQVASIQTYNARKDRDDFHKPDADLIILDEAHRSTSDTFKKLLEEYPDAYVVGLTATPIRNDGKALGNIYDELVESSNIRDLTAQGYLVKNRVFAPSIPDLQGLKISMGDYDKRQLDKRMNKTKLVGDTVSHWIKFAENRPTVVFASSIAHSKYIANIFNQNGVPAGHIDSEMNDEDREQVLKDLQENRIKVLSNCMILTEGWDCPKVSCVVICRPTKSYGMYLQMVGRSLRPHPDKNDTLIIDHSGCIYEHGFPEDVPKWELKTNKEKEKKKRDPKPIDKQPYTCVKCDFVYKMTKENPECPNCSHVPTKKEEIMLIKQGRLIELPKMKETKAEDKKRFYAQLLFIAKQKGYKEGWASHTFREKFHHFPHSKMVLPIPPTNEVHNFIKHLQIKKAKSKGVRL
jgi:superfamily II DNA or RNA helicase